MAKVAAFSDEVKKAIKKRAANRCDVCGSGVMYAHYHHRDPRGMGGSSNKSLGLPSNALYLHPKCHERIEQNRWEATINGWIITGRQDPATVPANLWDGWHLLTEEGTLAPVPPDGTPARDG